jgi:signal-transduction protein with cAMP-binding, CBS, and nucleotidyltransferase domain
MALDEEQSSAAHEMRRAIDCLRDCADLAGVDPASLEALAAGTVQFSLPAGSLLFESGSTPEGVYLVANGRLGVKTLGIARLTAEIERSQLVGETGWLLKEQHSATVFALRDSELLLLPTSLLDAVAAQSTNFSLALARLCARRLRRSNRQAREFLPLYPIASRSTWPISRPAWSRSSRAPAGPSWSGMREPAPTPPDGSMPSKNRTTTWCT